MYFSFEDVGYFDPGLLIAPCNGSRTISSSASLSLMTQHSHIRFSLATPLLARNLAARSTTLLARSMLDTVPPLALSIAVMLLAPSCAAPSRATQPFPLFARQ